MRLGAALFMIAVGSGLWFGRADHFSNWKYGKELIWVPAAHLLLAYGTWDLVKELVWRYQRRRRPRHEL